MSFLAYNGIAFSYIRTSQYEEEAIFDQSGTDYLYNHVTIRIDAVMAFFLTDVTKLSSAVTVPPGDTAADLDVQDTFTRIRSALETPRQYLQYGLYDPTLVGPHPTPTYIVFSKGIDATVGTQGLDTTGVMTDVKNGPIPKVMAIDRVDGENAFHVHFQIETWILKCPPGAAQQPQVLSHRWTEQISFDKTFAVSYRRQGRLIVPSTASTGNSTSSADSFRNTTYVPLRTGFRRENGQYILSEDGLGLAYSFEDKMLFRTLPSPAVDGKFTYTESTGTGASLRHASVEATLIGRIDSNNSTSAQQGMLEIAFIMAMQNFGNLTPPPDLAKDIELAKRELQRVLNPGKVIPGPPGENNVFNPPENQNILYRGADIARARRKLKSLQRNTAIILGASLSYEGFTNSVTVKIEAQLPPAKRVQVGLPFKIANFVQTPPGAFDANGGQGKMPIPFLQGQLGTYNANKVADLTLLANVVGVPCREPATPGAIGDAAGAQGAVAGVAVGSTAKSLTADVPGDAPTNYNTAAGLYTYYYISISYRDKQNTLQSPNATPAGGPKTCSIVQWADPMDDAEVTFEAIKVDDYPDVPSKVMADSNFVFIDGVDTFEPPVLRGDGYTEEFHVSGKRYYAIVDPSKLVMQTGLYPWMASSVAVDTIVPQVIFTPTIMNPTAGGGGGTQGQIPQISITPVGGSPGAQ